MGIHIAVIEPGRDPYLKEVEPEDREGLESSYLGAFQREVGGNVEAYNVLWGDQPSLYVNEDGSQPNRAIYANDHMEKERYLSQMDYKSVVKAGDLYGLTFGTFIAVSYDQETTGAGNTYGVVCGFCHCSISGYASREAANERWNYRYHEHRKEGE